MTIFGSGPESYKGWTEATAIVQRWEFQEEIWPLRHGIILSVHRRYRDYTDFMGRMEEFPEAREVDRLAGGIMEVAGQPGLPPLPPELAIVKGAAFPRVMETNSDGVKIDTEYDREIVQNIIHVTNLN